MLADLRENAKKLKLHPADFEFVLMGIGFGPAEHLKMTDEGQFCRPIDVYTKM